MATMIRTAPRETAPNLDSSSGFDPAFDTECSSLSWSMVRRLNLWFSTLMSVETDWSDVKGFNIDVKTNYRLWRLFIRLCIARSAELGMRTLLRAVFNVDSHCMRLVSEELSEKRRCVSACLATGVA